MKRMQNGRVRWQSTRSQVRTVAILFITSVLVAACGGSGGSESTPADDEPATVGGVVTDAVTGAPLNGVFVALNNDSSARTVTAPDGSWQMGPLEISDGTFRFSHDGYRPELLSSSAINSLTPTINSLTPTITNLGPAIGTRFPNVNLIPEDNAGDGGLSGTVTGREGVALGDVVLNFIEGINVRDGDIAGTATTTADGSWSVNGLGYGNYTCIVLIPGEDPIYQIVQVLGGINRTDQNVLAPSVSVAPSVQPDDALGPDEIRIELDWLLSAADLRHVLVTPDGREISRQSPEFENGVVELDVEFLTDSSITLSRDFLEGLSYSVVRGGIGIGSAISTNQAEVRVVDQSGVIATFNVQPGISQRWDVFQFINGVPVETVSP